MDNIENLEDKLYLVIEKIMLVFRNLSCPYYNHTIIIIHKEATLLRQGCDALDYYFDYNCVIIYCYQCYSNIVIMNVKIYYLLSANEKINQKNQSHSILNQQSFYQYLLHK